MADEHIVSLGDARLQLLGERAVFWPAQQALLIADLHLGKADVLRRAGILAPRGSTSADLERLQQLIAEHRPRTLWILGDLLHGPLLDAPWLQRWRQFRAAHAQLAIQVIAGNHDRALRADILGLDGVHGAADLDGLHLCHEPPPAAPAPFVCGHLHPCVRLPGLPRRWPAFVLTEQGLQLPAFSLFTGGLLIDHRSAGACFACVEGEVIALPSPRRQITRRVRN